MVVRSLITHKVAEELAEVYSDQALFPDEI